MPGCFVPEPGDGVKPGGVAGGSPAEGGAGVWGPAISTVAGLNTPCLRAIRLWRIRALLCFVGTANGAFWGRRWRRPEMKAANHVEPESGAHSRGRGILPPTAHQKGGDGEYKAKRVKTIRRECNKRSNWTQGEKMRRRFFIRDGISKKTCYNSVRLKKHKKSTFPHFRDFYVYE